MYRCTSISERVFNLLPGDVHPFVFTARSTFGELNSLWRTCLRNLLFTGELVMGPRGQRASMYLFWVVVLVCVLAINVCEYDRENR